MPEGTDPNASTQDGNNPSDITSGAGDSFKPIKSQEDLNRIITDRVGRERSKYSDYEDLKAKAGRFDQLDAANKSEIEKANDAKTSAEQRAANAEAEALRWKVAAKHGIPEEDAALFLTGTDEETLNKQAERLTQRVSDRKTQNNRVPREGTTPREPPEDEMRAFTRQLFQGAD